MAFQYLRVNGLAAIARGFSSQLSEIPIKRVARVLRFNVGNEENGLLCDKMLKDTIPLYKTIDGYVKIERTICKSEWGEFEHRSIFTM
jgi:hypothetical protein